jgi:hypothetical protein
MMKKIALFVIALFLAACPVQAAEISGEEESRGLIDVSASHWAKGQIELAVQKGYVSGFPDGSFRPDDKVTRAQFIRMLADALKLPHVEQGYPWYQPYVAALVETGIHKEKDFSSEYDKPITRMEMVRLAVRAVNLSLQLSGESPDDAVLMHEATSKGIIHGMGNGELAPDGHSTRAQAVAVIERVLAVFEGKSLPVDEQAIQTSQSYLAQKEEQS